MRWRATLLLVSAGLALGACSSREAAGQRVDQAKLSAELESRAKLIEQRADQAAAAAERQASDELAALNAEAARAAAAPPAAPSPAEPAVTRR